MSLSADDVKHALEQMVTDLQPELERLVKITEHRTVDLFMRPQRLHAWTKALIEPSVILEILQGALEVLRLLGVGSTHLLQLPRTELTPAWSKVLEQHEDASWREAPSLPELEREIIRNVAAYAYAVRNTGIRHRAFTQNGPPLPSTRPEYSAQEKAALPPLPWAFRSTPAATANHKQLMDYKRAVRGRQKFAEASPRPSPSGVQPAWTD